MYENVNRYYCTKKLASEKFHMSSNLIMQASFCINMIDGQSLEYGRRDAKFLTLSPFYSRSSAALWPYDMNGYCWTLPLLAPCQTVSGTEMPYIIFASIFLHTRMSLWEIIVLNGRVIRELSSMLTFGWSAARDLKQVQNID
jgi:hypothetical protein